MLILIDADSLAYANSVSVQKDGSLIPKAEEIMCNQLDRKIEGIVLDIEKEFKGDIDYKLFLTGSGNFREKEFPLYKQNRKGLERPILLPEIRDYMEQQYNAVVIQGMEADDAVCIEQQLGIDEGRNTIIAHIDKDIDQQEGWHYKWETHRKGKTYPSKIYQVGKTEAALNLYKQALVGDRADNIMMQIKEETGNWSKEYGAGEKTARTLLEGCSTDLEMYNVCLDQYNTYSKFNGDACTEQDLLDNLHQLYLIRALHPRTAEPVRYTKPTH